jgi:purine nucleoside phosphorylase
MRIMAGQKVAAVSCITNAAGGDAKTGALIHQDVLAMGEKKKDAVAKFLKIFAQLYAER